MLSAETIRLARVALFERGHIMLDTRNHKMVSVTLSGIPEARAYNELAKVAVK